MRVFIGLGIPMKKMVQYRHLEQTLQTSFLENNMVAYFKDEGQFHITLQFLGDITEAQVKSIDFLDSAAKDFGQPDLFISGIGAVPSIEKANKLMLGVRKEPKLEKLFLDIKENLKMRGFNSDKRPFVPHITIANLAKPYKIFSALGSVQQMFSLIDFKAESINVYKSEPSSQGSNYKVLQTAPLVAPILGKL